MKAAKPAVQKRQADLLAERYDLANRPATGVDHVARQAGAGGRARQAAGRHRPGTQLAGDDAGRRSASKDLFPTGFLPLPHPNHPEGGMLFPKFAHRRDQEAGRRAT